MGVAIIRIRVLDRQSWASRTFPSFSLWCLEGS